MAYIKLQVLVSDDQAEALLQESLNYFGEVSPKKEAQIRRNATQRRDLIRKAIERRLPA